MTLGAHRRTRCVQLLAATLHRTFGSLRLLHVCAFIHKVVSQLRLQVLGAVDLDLSVAGGTGLRGDTLVASLRTAVGNIITVSQAIVLSTAVTEERKVVVLGT